MFCLLLPSLQSGMNLQICFVNDSGSDKDSDADDSKTETSLDTPLSPMVSLQAATEVQSVLSWSHSFCSIVDQEQTLQRFKNRCLMTFLNMWSVKVTHSCLILATPWTVCSLPGSSVHGIFQARIQEWEAIPFSRGSSCLLQEILYCLSHWGSPS